MEGLVNGADDSEGDELVSAADDGLADSDGTADTDGTALGDRLGVTDLDGTALGERLGSLDGILDGNEVGSFVGLGV